MEYQPFYTELGAGEPLILLHGNGEDHTFFNGQTEAFAVCRRVILVDTRGHGCSPRGDAPFTLRQFADDLLALIDALRLPRADLLGYSDGGNIALLFALRYPERVSRLILYGANLYPRGLKTAVLVGIDVIYGCLLAAERLSARARRKRELYGLMATQPDIPARRLSELTMPTLVIAGTHDLIREKHTRLIAASLPNGRLALLPGGHAVAKEHPEAFNRVVLDFLQARAG